MSNKIYTDGYQMEEEVQTVVLEEVSPQQPQVSLIIKDTSANTTMQFDYDRAVTAMSKEKRSEYLEKAKREIDIERPSSIRHYGQDITKAVSSIADKIIDKTRSNKGNESMELLNTLVIELKGLQEKNEDEGGALSWFKRLPVIRTIVKKGIETKVENAMVGDNVREISEKFVAMRASALAKSVDMENLRETCKEYVVQSREKTLGIIILREDVKNRLDELERSSVADLDEIQNLRMADTELSKKITSLETNEHLFQQNMFQVAVLQNNASSIIDKCESAIRLIPVVRTQLAISSETEEQRNQVEMIKRFDDFSNEVMIKNMKTLHDESIELAKKVETPSVRLETLQQTKNELIDIVKSIKEIRNHGEEQREAIRQGLQTLSDELNEAIRSEL